MSAEKADFCGGETRIPKVKVEVHYEYDSKHRAVNISACSHEENFFITTNQQTRLALHELWLLLNSAYAHMITSE